MLTLLRRLGRAWDTVELMVGGVFLTLSVILIVAEIAGRNLLGVSMVGADEIASYMVIWSVFFTASIAAKKNMHIRIDVIFTLASPAVGRMLDIFGSLMSAAFAAYLTYSGMVLVHDSWIFGETTMTMLRLPLWVPQLIMPIGGFLLTVRLVQRVVHLLKTPASALVSEAVHSPTA